MECKSSAWVQGGVVACVCGLIGVKVCMSSRCNNEGRPGLQLVHWHRGREP